MKKTEKRQGPLTRVQAELSDLAWAIVPQSTRNKARYIILAWFLSAALIPTAVEAINPELTKPVEYLNPVVKLYPDSNIQVKEVEVIKWKSVEDDIQGYIEYVFGDEAEHAKKIAKCESGFRPTATNVNVDGTEDRGVFQINNKYHGSCSTHNAKANIDCAKKIKDSWGNWNAWVCNKLI